MNWTPEQIVSLVSGLTGLVGLLVAALSVWLSYKDRSSAHRELLYQKQIEAYTAILNSLTTLYFACLSFIVSTPHQRLDSETRPELREAVDGKMRQFLIKYQNRLLFLPSIIQKEVLEFFYVFNAITAPDNEASRYPPTLVYSDNPLTELYKAYRKVIEAARQALGVEPLSKDILGLVGTSEPEDILGLIGTREAKKNDKHQKDSN